MSDRGLWRLGAIVAALSLALFLCGLAFLLLDLRAVPDPLTAQAPWFVSVLVTVPLGLLIIRKQGRNPIGWLLLAIGFGNALYLPAGFIAMYGQLHGATHAAYVEWLVWLFEWLGSAGAGLLVLLLLLFPDGALPSRRWRPVFAAAVVLITTELIVGMLTQQSGSNAQLSPALPAVRNPVGIFPANGAASVVTTALPLPLLLIALALVVVRLRRSRGVHRRQLVAFAAVAAVTLVVIIVSFPFGSLNVLGTDIAAIVWGFGLGVLLPGTIGLAVIRYGLYDIDVFISRALVYGSLAVFITAVYVAIAVGIGAAAGSGGKPNVGLSIVATVIVALGFQPVRERLQRMANRLVYGRRATPYEVLTEFSPRAAQTYDVSDVLPRMARVLQAGTGAEVATVWLRRGDRLEPAASFPESFVGYEPVAINGDDFSGLAAVSRAVPVRHEQQLLGALSIVKRRGESLTPIEQSLMDDLAGQAGLVLRNVALTAELRQRLEELRQSRQRLVSAQDDERRRLERNLHDGAQQHLVAMKVKLGLADTLASRDPDKAVAMLEQLKDDADEALQTLRDLARGIYPPLLADKGLVAALESQVRKATFPVTVEHDGVGRYSQDVEATVYFCALEALQNVQKYANAKHATIRLEADDRTLRFSVADDGIGFDGAATQRGAGLINMADRIDSLNGGLWVTSKPGRGTTVSGTLPITPTSVGVAAFAVAV